MSYSIVVPEVINDKLKRHLIRNDRQEDLCFALYSIARGKHRITGIINEVVLPEPGDRNIHGNASFNSQYFDRVSQLSLQRQKGIAFLHSHPGPGWQDMSLDDIDAEKMLSPRVKAITNLPLIGMTIGNNGDWSGRFWNKTMPKVYNRDWCESVRVVGERFITTFNNNLLKEPALKEELTRTVSAWGIEKQGQISRTRVGVVGLGSVGSQIAEALMRVGIQNIFFIDFDLVEMKNLDRLQGLNQSYIGYYKSDTYSKILMENRLDLKQNILSYPYSIVEREGFEAALDCDILFCCVDKPWARFILNCISYAYLIPVIDGGIDASFSKKSNNLEQARWRTYIAAPQRRCMKCMGQYKPEDVSLEQTGLLEDPLYIKGLPEDHFINHGENVYAFSMSLAGLQMQQFLSYILTPKGVFYGPKEMDFVTGNIDFDFKFECDANCEFNSLIGQGDNIREILIQKHLVAEKMRRLAKKFPSNRVVKPKWLKKFIDSIKNAFLSFKNKKE